MSVITGQSAPPRQKKSAFKFILGALLLGLTSAFTTTTFAQTTETAVQKFGKLRVQGNRIVDQTGAPVQLRGMSLYWSQWIPKFWNASTVKWLRDDWKIDLIRAPMGVNGSYDGYLVDPTTEKNKVIAVVDAAIQHGIYVIIDWHDHTASDHRAQAQAFFAEMAQRYGNTPNVIYETWNEPLAVSWASVIKPYHQAVISSIRQYDPDNIIVCGTANWSQGVAEAAADPIAGTNIAYTLHFYAGSHKQWLRDNATTALNAGAALFVTEYGTTDASGDGAVDSAETALWYSFLDQNKISAANWSIADISESSAALYAGASGTGGWTTSQIKPSGVLARNECINKKPDLSGGPIQAGVYSIRNRASGKMLDNLGSTADGASVGQWTDGTSYNQRWMVSYQGGYARLQCLTGEKFLDSLAHSADNTVVGQWSGSTSYNQQWTIQSLGNGYYKIINRANGKCLDTGGSMNNSTAVSPAEYMEFWSSGSSYNQQWQFVAP